MWTIYPGVSLIITGRLSKWALQECTLNIIYIIEMGGNSCWHQGSCAHGTTHARCSTSVVVREEAQGSSGCTAELQLLWKVSDEVWNRTQLSQPHTSTLYMPSMHLLCSSYFMQKLMEYWSFRHLLTGSLMEIMHTVPIFESGYKIYSWSSNWSIYKYIVSNPIISS